MIPRSSIPPESDSGVPEARRSAPASFRVPEVTNIPPAAAFVPESNKVPDPDFTTVPVPVTKPLNVPDPLWLKSRVELSRIAPLRLAELPDKVPEETIMLPEEATGPLRERVPVPAMTSVPVPVTVPVKVPFPVWIKRRVASLRMDPVRLDDVPARVPEEMSVPPV
jgi:hypothetical protein